MRKTPQLRQPNRKTLADLNTSDSVYFRAPSNSSNTSQDPFQLKRRDNEIALLKHSLKNAQEEAAHYQRMCLEMEQEKDCFVGVAEVEALRREVQAMRGQERLWKEAFQGGEKSGGEGERHVATLQKARNQILEHQLNKAREKASRIEQSYEELLKAQRQLFGCQKQTLLKRIKQLQALPRR